MASQTGSSSFPLSEKSREGAHIIARQDRIPSWSFPYLFIAIILSGYLVVASVLAMFGTSTRNKRLDEVAP